MQGCGKDKLARKPVCKLQAANVEISNAPDGFIAAREFCIPLLHEGGIDTFLQEEVLPYAPDAWYSPEQVKVGYEINFNRHFYKPTLTRSLEEIRADILALEQKSEGLLEEILAI